jgi:hypothetical protein
VLPANVVQMLQLSAADDSRQLTESVPRLRATNVPPPRSAAPSSKGGDNQKTFVLPARAKITLASAAASAPIPTKRMAIRARNQVPKYV